MELFGIFLIILKHMLISIKEASIHHSTKKLVNNVIWKLLLKVFIFVLEGMVLVPLPSEIKVVDDMILKFRVDR